MAISKKMYQLLKFYTPSISDVVYGISGMGLGTLFQSSLSDHTPFLGLALGYLSSRYFQNRMIPRKDRERRDLELLISDIQEYQKEFMKSSLD